jgi:L,D-transpeptidase ErfK/SrfK
MCRRRPRLRLHRRLRVLLRRLRLRRQRSDVVDEVDGRTLLQVGGEDFCSSPPIVVAVLLSVVVASGLIGCGPTALNPNRETAAPPAESDRRDDARMADHAIPSEQASTYVVLRLKERRLDLMRDGAPAPIASFPIAVGRAGQETPTGRFHVEEMVEHPDYDQIDPHDRSRVLKRIPPGPENPLGERWIGFAHGDGWTVGIHGTPQPQLLGQAVSGGCIRMRNIDVIRVYDSVKLGTPVLVYP